jgi:hypothetical protein
MGRSVIGGSLVGYRAPAAVYSGPGDVVSGAGGWWGLRAYTAASIGANAVRLREDGGNTEQDFVTIAGGGLDLAAISTFKGANNLFVVTLYDQTGSGFDVTQVTAANQPDLILSGLGAFPIIRTDAGRWLTATGSPLSALGVTVSWVAKRTSVNGNFNSVVKHTTNGVNVGFNNGSGSVYSFSGAVVTALAAENTFHAVQCTILGTGANDIISVDGTDTSGLNAGGIAPTGNITFSGDAGAQHTVGDTVEFGAWTSVFDGTQRNDMSANQRAYWGF